MDTVSPKKRSQMMAGIRHADTKPELLVRKALFSAGFRFRLHCRNLPGVPDIVLHKHRVAVFVNGCYWHRHDGCKYFKLPSTRVEFWKEKLNGNKQRDRQNSLALQSAGWRVLTIWECAVRDREILNKLPQLFADWLKGENITGEITGSAS